MLASCTWPIGGSNAQASEAVAAETLNVLRTFVNTGEAIHCVNPAVIRRRVEAPAKEVASTDSVLQALERGLRSVCAA
jgi:hypothetical protein